MVTLESRLTVLCIVAAFLLGLPSCTQQTTDESSADSIKDQEAEPLSEQSAKAVDDKPEPLPLNSSHDLESSGLIGTWDLESKEVLPNGHYVVAKNVDTYQKDGTFREDSRMKLMDGGTHKPFVTVRTESSGTWTLKENEICRTYDNARLVGFESTIPDMTRDQMAQQIQDDVAQTEPECFVIISVTPNRVILRDAESTTDIVLNRTAR